VAALAFALPAPTPAAAASQAPGGDDEGELEAELSTAAKQLSDFLKRRERNEVVIGPFTCPPQLNGSAGPRIAKTLAESLEDQGIKIKRLAELGVKGEYRLVLKTGQRGPEAQIQGDLEDIAGRKLFHFTRNVHGEATLAHLFGLTVSLDPSEGERQRGERIIASVKAPETLVKETRVSAGRSAPYAVEVLVKQGGDYVPRAPTNTDGLAFVEIHRGEIYAVRLINNSDQDAAVTLTIDGLSIFAFSEHENYKYVIVPGRSQGVISGWHVTNDRSDAFQVTEYAKSAAAQKLPSSAMIGTITATFAAAWPKESSPPGDENRSRLVMRGRDATGRGPSVAAKYQVLERVIGVPRCSVSVRYTKDG
jgi:hypothetical protein